MILFSFHHALGGRTTVVQSQKVRTKYFLLQSSHLRKISLSSHSHRVPRHQFAFNSRNSRQPSPFRFPFVPIRVISWLRSFSPQRGTSHHPPNPTTLSIPNPNSRPIRANSRQTSPFVPLCFLRVKNFCLPICVYLRSSAVKFFPPSTPETPHAPRSTSAPSSTTSSPAPSDATATPKNKIHFPEPPIFAKLRFVTRTHAIWVTSVLYPGFSCASRNLVSLPPSYSRSY